MADYAVRTDQLREIAAVLCDDLTRSAELFADRWHEGLRLMAAQTRRTADALRLAAEVYEQADRLASTSAARP